jgi:hypothetical protein
MLPTPSTLGVVSQYRSTSTRRNPALLCNSRSCCSSYIRKPYGVNGFRAAPAGVIAPTRSCPSGRNTRLISDPYRPRRRHQMEGPGTASNAAPALAILRALRQDGSRPRSQKQDLSRSRKSGSQWTRRWREVDSNFRFRAHGEVRWSAVSLDIPRGMRHGVRRSTALSPARLAIPWSRGRIRF